MFNKELEDFLKECFNTTLSLKKIDAELRQRFCLKIDWQKIIVFWESVYGHEAYIKRRNNIKKVCVADNWSKRDDVEKKATITKSTTAARLSRKKIKEEVALKCNELLNLTTQEILKNVKNLKLNFELKDKSEQFVQCQLCGKISRQLMGHILHHHNITGKIYKKLFPNALLICLESVIKHATAVRINTRSISLDVDQQNAELESRFINNRLRSYEKVIERDVVCQECGKTDLLDVHHIIPHRLFKRYDQEQDNIDNLILLCKKCHSTLGQRLDDVIISIFEIYIKLKNPITYKTIIYRLKQHQKIFLKRKCGAPAKYCVTQKQLETFIENSIVNVNKASEKLNVPDYIIKRFCRDFKLSFDSSFNCNTKVLKTKNCPCCSWSGAFRFTTHLLTTDDDDHTKFLEEFKQKYAELKSTECVAKYYEKNNITKAIVKNLLRDLKINSGKKTKV